MQFYEWAIAISRSSGVSGLYVVLIGVLGACGGNDGPSEGLAVSRTMKGDVLHVHTTRPLRGDTADLVEQLRIGVASGPSEFILHEVRALAVDNIGRVYIGDREGIRIYTAQGRYLRRLARRGSGPGEVLFVTAMDIHADGRIVALDLGNRRVNVYGPSGGSLDTWRLPPGMPGNGRVGVIAVADGSTYVAFNPPLPADGGPQKFPRPAFVQLDPSGAVQDTIWIGPEWAERCPTLSSSWWRAGYYEDLRAPYFPKVQWAIGRDGRVAVGCPSDYSFKVHGSESGIVRASRNWQPIQPSRAERNDFVAAWNSQRGSPGGWPVPWSWTGPEPPEQRPAYERMFFEPSGRVWIWPTQRREPQEDDSGATNSRARSWRPLPQGAFDVFDIDLAYLGAVRWPAELQYSPYPGRADPYVRGDTVWAVMYDSLGVEYLTKYTIQWRAQS